MLEIVKFLDAGYIRNVLKINVINHWHIGVRVQNHYTSIDKPNARIINEIFLLWVVCHRNDNCNVPDRKGSKMKIKCLECGEDLDCEETLKRCKCGILYGLTPHFPFDSVYQSKKTKRLKGLPKT